MTRTWMAILAVMGLVFGTSVALAAPVDPVPNPQPIEKKPEPPRPAPDADGKVKGVVKSLEGDMLTVTVGDKEFAYKLSDDVVVLTAAGKPYAEASKFRVLGRGGMEVSMKVEKKDGKEIVPEVQVNPRRAVAPPMVNPPMILPVPAPPAANPVPPPAKDGAIQGKLKSVDAEKKIIVIVVDGKEKEFKLEESTKILSAAGKEIADGLKAKNFEKPENITVAVTVEKNKDGKEVVTEVKIVARNVPGVIRPNPANPANPVPAPEDKPKEGAIKGQLKKVDAEKRIIVVTVDGKEKEFKLEESTKILTGAGKEIADGLKAKTFENPDNLTVEVVIEKNKDGKEVVTEIKITRKNPNPGNKPPIQIKPIQIKPIQIQPGRIIPVPPPAVPEIPMDK